VAGTAFWAVGTLGRLVRHGGFMKVLAVVVALALVALPFVGCGGGGPACVGTCGICNFSEDCCGFASGELCTDASSDFAPRCSPSDFFCKLTP
jgi:hypothetical protein